jgi:hypothetical protein
MRAGCDVVECEVHVVDASRRLREQDRAGIDGGTEDKDGF